MTGSGDPRSTAKWSAFTKATALSLIATIVLLYGFVLTMDPYGTRVGPGHPPAPLMDLNQRYMYPQLARSGLFDSALFGTSTIRLLDPAGLSDLFGTRFANLGLNAGTPWEQVELASLFLRHVPHPKLLIFGLDRNWCEPDADLPARRLTFRSFPPWLYNEDPLDDYPDQLNLRSVEIASRVALQRLGFVRERIRQDGYEVFTPPEARYDLVQARRHIWAEDRSVPATRNGKPGFPALAWLDTLLSRVPAQTQVMLLLPPIHVAAQAKPGSRDDEVDGACKAAIAGIARRHEAAAIDFRYASALTREDSNYWDKLHYRSPIAAALSRDIKAAHDTGRDAPDGSYKVLSFFRS